MPLIKRSDLPRVHHPLYEKENFVDMASMLNKMFGEEAKRVFEEVQAVKPKCPDCSCELPEDLSGFTKYEKDVEMHPRHSLERYFEAILLNPEFLDYSIEQLNDEPTQANIKQSSEELARQMIPRGINALETSYTLENIRLNDPQGDARATGVTQFTCPSCGGVLVETPRDSGLTIQDVFLAPTCKIDFGISRKVDIILSALIEKKTSELLDLTENTEAGIHTPVIQGDMSQPEFEEGETREYYRLKRGQKLDRDTLRPTFDFAYIQGTTCPHCNHSQPVPDNYGSTTTLPEDDNVIPMNIECEECGEEFLCNALTGEVIGT